MEVSVVLAAYNEDDILKDNIENLIISLEKEFDDYELVLVNDASTDNTSEIMENFAQENSKVTVLQNIINLNFGTATLRGLKQAKKEWVIYISADMCITAEEIKDLINNANKKDVIVLKRTLYGGDSWRKITSKINCFMLHVLFPKLTKDTPILNYMQIFRRENLNICIPLARSPIFVWPEMIFRAKLAGLKVTNLKHTPHIKKISRGSFGKPHDIIWGIYDMLRFRIRLWQRKI